MGKLVVTEFVTLDGVMEDPGGAEKFDRGGWAFKFDRGPDGDRFKLDELMASDAQLLGRVTYEGFAKAWPTMQGTGEFGEKMNAMPKFVVSQTLTDPEWNNTTVLTGDLREEVGRLADDESLRLGCRSHSSFLERPFGVGADQKPKQDSVRRGDDPALDALVTRRLEQLFDRGVRPQRLGPEFHDSADLGVRLLAERIAP